MRVGHPPPAPGPRSILIADDEPGLRDLFHYLLEPAGYEVVTAADGLETIAQVERRAFDLVILDVHMPGMSGPETLKGIRAVRPGQKVVIATSGLDVNRAFEGKTGGTGEIECGSKPVTIEELTEVIQRALGGSQERKEP